MIQQIVLPNQGIFIRFIRSRFDATDIACVNWQQLSVLKMDTGRLQIYHGGVDRWPYVQPGEHAINGRL